MALDLSDPELLRAIASVRSDNTAHNYCVLGYSAKNKLGVTAMGDGPTPWSFVDEMEEDSPMPVDVQAIKESLLQPAGAFGVHL